LQEAVFFGSVENREQLDLVIVHGNALSMSQDEAPLLFTLTDLQDNVVTMRSRCQTSTSLAVHELLSGGNGRIVITTDQGAQSS
jgi:hypothetical protein